MSSAMILCDVTVPFVGVLIIESRPLPKTSPFYEYEWAGSDLEVWLARRWYVLLEPHERWRSDRVAKL